MGVINGCVKNYPTRLFGNVGMEREFKNKKCGPNETRTHDL